MKKSIYGVLATAGLAVTVLAGCGTSSTAGSNASSKGTGGSSASAKKVSAVGITPTVNPNATPNGNDIVVGVDDTYPPMEFKNDSGRLVGFDIDLGDELAKMIGKKIIWKPTQWNGIIAGLTSNQFNAIISSMNITPDRQKQISFVQYVSFGQVIVQPSKSTAKISSLSDLKGKKVGVQIGTTSEDAVKKAGIAKKNIKEYNTFPSAFQDLSAGRTAAVVVDEPVGRYYVAKQPKNYHLGKPFDSEPMGIGLRKNETSLQKQLTDALAKMKKNGEYDKIYQYWFGTKSGQ